MNQLTWYNLGTEQQQLIDLLDSLDQPCGACGGRDSMKCLTCLGSGVQPVDQEVRKAIEAQIAIYQGMQIAKVDPTAALIRELEAREEADTAEMKRLAARAYRWRSRLQRVKNLVLEFLIFTDQKKLEGQHSTFRRQGNGGLKPLDIPQPDLIPDSMKRVVVTLPLNVWRELKIPGHIVAEPDTAAIRVALERGEHVPGARLLDRAEHLRIT